MKFSVILGNLGNTCDRFLSTGYKEQLSKEEMFRQAASITGVQGIELVGTWDITGQNVGQIKTLLKEHSLACVSIIPDLFAQKRWGRGALTARDPQTRSEAVDEVRQMMDVAAELGCSLINLWPGQDGYDYVLQGDFLRARDWLLEGLRDCARHRSDVRISLEYKPREPRGFSYLARAADTLLLAQDSGENIGITIDTGHALMGGENLAETAALLMGKQALYHLHFNDNNGIWDDDMIVGSVHFGVYVELLYWLHASGYDGWYSMDQYPYREDGRGALAASIFFLRGLAARMDTYGYERIGSIIERGNAVESQQCLHALMGLA